MKYYNLLVESNKGISKNELNKFALESIIENNLPDGVQQSVVDYRKLNDIDNLNKASEAVSKNINEIQKAEETVKAVLETQEGFKDGLSSKLTSNPTKIAGAGAAVGLGAGAVNEINQKSKNKIAEVWRKIRSLFRKKQKALPEVQNDNDEQQYKDSLKYETGPNMGVNGSSRSNSQRANEDKERV
jgi:prefoldin subunit 5